jgi:hypothetical protein
MLKYLLLIFDVQLAARKNLRKKQYSITKQLSFDSSLPTYARFLFTSVIRPGLVRFEILEMQEFPEDQRLLEGGTLNIIPHDLFAD